eukprot:1157836-Pelagomonas_calceolata.AAC.2
MEPATQVALDCTLLNYLQLVKCREILQAADLLCLEQFKSVCRKKRKEKSTEAVETPHINEGEGATLTLNPDNRVSDRISFEQPDFPCSSVLTKLFSSYQCNSLGMQWSADDEGILYPGQAHVKHPGYLILYFPLLCVTQSTRAPSFA